jgi:hypothetical protein
LAVGRTFKTEQTAASRGASWLRGGELVGDSMKVEEFVHEQNLARYRRLLARDGAAPHQQRQQILILLAEEEAKDEAPGR